MLPSAMRPWEHDLRQCDEKRKIVGNAGNPDPSKTTIESSSWILFAF